MGGITHGITCKCIGCHALRTKALTEPGRYGHSGRYCTDCGEPAEPQRSKRYYPRCKKCCFAR